MNPATLTEFHIVRDARSPSWVMTGIWLALVGTATTVVAAELLLYVPGQKRIFEEYGLQLPWLSRWVIQASAFLVEYWWAVMPLVLAALCGAILLLRHAFASRALGTVFAVGVLTLLTMAGLTIVLAMALPMDDLRRGLSK